MRACVALLIATDAQTWEAHAMAQDTIEARQAIFEDLLQETDGGQRALDRRWLLDYTFDGMPLPLVDEGGRGIRNPGTWNATLSITTTEKGKYADLEISPGIWVYPLATDKHGKLDPSNRKFESAHHSHTPVIYFYKPVPNFYLLVGLVEVTAYDEGAAVSTIELMSGNLKASALERELERSYVSRVVETRLHQPRFREIVLRAYDNRCAVCELPDRSLLDAAHIRGDKDPLNGQPVVENGLALCAIHHRAYDARVIGIDPDYGLHVNPRAMLVQDGPTYEHSIKGLDGGQLAVRLRGDNRPDPYRLDLTYKEFLSAAS